MSDNKPNWLCQCGELWSQLVCEAINLFFSYWPIRLCWVLANSLYVVHNIIYNEKKGNWLIKSWCLISILECFYLLIKALCNVPQFLLLSILRSGFCFCCGSLACWDIVVCCGSLGLRLLIRPRLCFGCRTSVALGELGANVTCPAWNGLKTKANEHFRSLNRRKGQIRYRLIAPYWDIIN